MKKENNALEKENFEKLKKTAEAHGTVSEEKSEKLAENVEEISENLIEEEKVPVEIEKETEKKLRRDYGRRDPIELKSAWNPKTRLGEEVKSGKIKSIDEIFDSNKKILEDEIVDYLLDVKTDLILIGQAKGKFGGGKRRAWRQTQKKTKEGNIPKFSAMAIVGNEKGYVGIGTGNAKETLPARDKAIRKAKLNLIRIKRACSSFDCDCSDLHTVPFKISGRGGSTTVTLIPAPQGTGLVVGGELKKLLKFAGIKDVYSKTSGKKRTTFNLIKAGFDALNKTNLEVNKNE